MVKNIQALIEKMNDTAAALKEHTDKDAERQTEIDGAIATVATFDERLKAVENELAKRRVIQ